MAEAKTVEDIAKAAPPQNPETSEDHKEEAKEHAKEEKPKGTLENVVDESFSAAKYLGAFAAGVSFPYLLFPGDSQKRTNAMINAYPLAAGSTVEDMMLGKPINPVKSMKESLVGTIMANPLASLFKYIEIARSSVTNYAGTLPGGAAAVGALAAGQAIFVGSYMGLNHIIQNFSFKGLYEKFKKEYWPTMKNTWKYVLPLSSLNVLFLYKFGIAVQLAYGSLMSFLFRLVGPKQPGASLKNLYSELKGYTSAGVSVTGKLLKGVFYGVPEAFYGIGKGVADYFSVKTPAPKPAAAAHP